MEKDASPPTVSFAMRKQHFPLYLATSSAPTLMTTDNKMSDKTLE